MAQKTELSKLINYIEENLRTTTKTKSKFIDPQGFLGRLKTKQNHVVFGRRGAGKSLLTTSLGKDSTQNVIYINLEDFKDISFPNIIIRVLSKLLEELSWLIKKKSKWYSFKSRKFASKILKYRAGIDHLISTPDHLKKDIRTKEELSSNMQASFGNDLMSTGAGVGTNTEEEIKKSIIEDKLETLKKELTPFKRYLNNSSFYLISAPIFLVLDDFYFVAKSIQPEFLDYFHRLTKDTDLFIKVATIKHRSKLYKQTSQSYIGTEIGADILDVDLDYTLDKFRILRTFMKNLLEEAAKYSDSNVEIDDLFMGDGFSQLCLASGGVPRDFLSLFVKLGSKMMAEEFSLIGKIQVTDCAIENIGNKMGSFKTDSAEEREALETYLQEIRAYVYSEKRTNTFLVSKSDLETFVQERQAIKELVDLRLIHLLNNNTSCAPSDGKRYEAYMLDIGLYENSRPRNFVQVEPDDVDESSRKDKLRSSPKVSLEKLKQKIGERHIDTTLEITKV